ncbi:uncharacterized protein LOC141595603 [Silene latifolia]|uniref:uncharacterized protein LOC141595603 n=1 Tax=Silene latifolia TaxID=37657 RepID=UPI003D7769C4
MVGSNMNFGNGNTICDEDDLYIPVKSRKNKNLKKKQEQKVQKELNFVASIDEKVEVLVNGNVGSPKDEKLKLGIVQNNLSRFLESTIPSVAAQYFSKTTMKGWRTCDVEYQHYFTLGDLWDSFRECSAYGAGVPLVLNGIDDGIVQYYVPYLSAIQLFGQSSKFDGKSSGRQSDDDCKLSSSDDSSDYEVEEDVNYSTVSENFQKKEEEVASNTLPSLGMQQQSLEGFCSDESDGGSSRGEMLFQFFEKESPYCREPLASKAGELASVYPQLKTLRSCDLHPSSWMSVAWYPIYRIPSASTLKDLDACFLTYHCLSTPLEGEGSMHSPKLIDSLETDGTLRFSLPAFGLGSYKFKGVIWTGKRESECPLVNSLTESADRWLKQLQVNHPDFEFFLSRSLYQR